MWKHMSLQLQQTQDLLFGLDFDVVFGPSTEVKGAETIAENQKTILYRCTVQHFVLLMSFTAFSIIA
jgi:hypothetical protein